MLNRKGPYAPEESVDPAIRRAITKAQDNGTSV